MSRSYLQRPAYFDRQVIRAIHLSSEQDYQDQLKALDAQYLSGWGMVFGGVVTKVNANRSWDVQISPGYGKTGSGEPIYIETVQNLNLEEWAENCLGDPELCQLHVENEGLGRGRQNQQCTGYLVARYQQVDTLREARAPNTCRDHDNRPGISGHCYGVTFALLCENPFVGNELGQFSDSLILATIRFNQQGIGNINQHDRQQLLPYAELLAVVERQTRDIDDLKAKLDLILNGPPIEEPDGLPQQPVEEPNGLPQQPVEEPDGLPQQPVEEPDEPPVQDIDELTVLGKQDDPAQDFYLSEAQLDFLRGKEISKLEQAASLPWRRFELWFDVSEQEAKRIVEFINYHWNKAVIKDDEPKQPPVEAIDELTVLGQQDDPKQDFYLTQAQLEDLRNKGVTTLAEAASLSKEQIKQWLGVSDQQTVRIFEFIQYHWNEASIKDHEAKQLSVDLAVLGQQGDDPEQGFYLTEEQLDILRSKGITTLEAAAVLFKSDISDLFGISGQEAERIVEFIQYHTDEAVKAGKLEPVVLNL